MNQTPPDFLWTTPWAPGSLQQALFDAVGKAMGVPFTVTGKKIATVLSSVGGPSTCPAPIGAGVQSGAAAEVTPSFKTKARPWFEPPGPVRKTDAHAPGYLKVNFRFQLPL